MNIKSIDFCIVFSLTAYCAAFAAEPTAMGEVKMLAVHDSAATASSTICVSILEDRLESAGFTIVNADTADAEMDVTLAVGDGSDDDIDVDYLIKIVSLPSRRALLKFQGHQQNTLKGACKWMAKKTLSKIEDAE